MDVVRESDIAPAEATAKGFKVRQDQAETVNQQEKGGTDMKRILGATVALAMLAIYISSVEAVIKIETATVQN